MVGFFHASEPGERTDTRTGRLMSFRICRAAPESSRYGKLMGMEHLKYGGPAALTVDPLPRTPAELILHVDPLPRTPAERILHVDPLPRTPAERILHGHPRSASYTVWKAYGHGAPEIWWTRCPNSGPAAQDTRGAHPTRYGKLMGMEHLKYGGPAALTVDPLPRTPAELIRRVDRCPNARPTVSSSLYGMDSLTDMDVAEQFVDLSREYVARDPSYTTFLIS
ncbi:hypothetical protein C8R43DRAFT_1118427 [Mycena crocata]|nr:hypothetical protein C8R43DRAFT_1118427 [Mycena crocata]